MKKLLINSLIFGGPLLITLVFFVGDDPFGIFYNNNAIAEGSGDVAVTREFMEGRYEKKFNSFVFGNSRTKAFFPKDLSNYFKDTAILCFGAPGESVLNIRKKLELITGNHLKVKNAIVLLDEGTLQNTDNEHAFYKGPVYNHSPLTSNMSYFQFYSNYIQYYYSDLFFLKHILFRVSGKYIDWMANAFKDPGREDLYRGKNYPSLEDSLIENNFAEYKRVFHPNYSDNSKDVTDIDQRDIAHLATIKEIFIRENTNYKIVVPPAFHKKKTSENVQKRLAQLFGSHVYDFTGINKITSDSTLNYENLHFTRRAALLILDSIYKRP